MRGLVDIPSLVMLRGAYNVLLHQSPDKCDISAFALYSQWARFDARLAEIWVAAMATEWMGFNPIELREKLAELPWPAAGAALLEFVALVAQPAPRFRHWKGLAVEDFAPADFEQFFIGQRRIGGKSMFDDARFPLEQYRRWGYLSREVLFNKPSVSKATLGTLSPSVRQEILRALLEDRSRTNTETYWLALDRRVSLRQAERDLQASVLVRAVGNTKGRYYIKRGRAKA